MEGALLKDQHTRSSSQILIHLGLQQKDGGSERTGVIKERLGCVALGKGLQVLLPTSLC